MIKKITLMTLLTTAIFTHIHATDDFPTENDCKGQVNLTTVEKEHVKIGDSCVQEASLFDLALYYLNGTGTDENEQKAVSFLEFLANREQLTSIDTLYSSTAQYNLGVYYSTNGDKKNLEKDFSWFKLSADSGDAKAQSTIGLYYLKGLGVNKSYDKALEYFEKAAEQGYAPAQYNLGALCYNGQVFRPGITMDYLKALAKDLFTESAAQGHELARKKLDNWNKNN